MRALREFTYNELMKVTSTDTTNGQRVPGAVLGAQSLELLLFSGISIDLDFMDVRNNVGQKDHRDHEYVRKHEDAVLRTIATEFAEKARDGLIAPAGRGSTGDRRLDACLVQTLDALRRMLRQYHDGDVMGPSEVPDSFRRAVHVVDAQLKELLRSHAAVTSIRFTTHVELHNLSLLVLDALVPADGHGHELELQSNSYFDRCVAADIFRANPDLFVMDAELLWKESRHWRRGIVVWWECTAFWLEATISSLITWENDLDIDE